MEKKVQYEKDFKDGNIFFDLYHQGRTKVMKKQMLENFEQKTLKIITYNIWFDH